MAHTESPAASAHSGGGTGGSAHRLDIDWMAAGAERKGAAVATATQIVK